MTKSLSPRKIVLWILAVFVMFLPRRLELMGIYSHRLFILVAAVLAFGLFGFRIRLKGVLRHPCYLVYMVYYILRYVIAAEYVSLIGFLVDTFLLPALIISLVESRKTLDYFIHIFLRILLLYDILCVVEMLTGFNIWRTIGAFVEYIDTKRYGFQRSFGSFTTYINNGAFLLLAFPLIYYARVYMKEKRMAAILHVATWAAIISTLSRGPLLVAVLLEIIWVWSNGLFRFIRRHFLAILLALLGLIALMQVEAVSQVVNSFLNMFLAIFDDDVASEISGIFGNNTNGIGHRLSLFNWVWSTLKSGNIWIGTGPNYAFNYAFLTSRGSMHVKQSIENYYLSQMYRFGIVGLALLITFLVSRLTEVRGRIPGDLRASAPTVTRRENTFQFRLYTTLICYYILLLTVSAVDDYKMFFILITISDCWARMTAPARAADPLWKARSERIGSARQGAAKV